ncbi:MAG: cAMP phosphodiesterase [Synechococcaceae cyanobacterium ELA739]
MASLSRRARLLLAAPLLVMPLVLSPAAALAAPASPAEMNLYTRIAAVNACISRSAGVDFDKAVGIAGETIAQVILGQHQGLIQQVGTKPLTLEELRKGSINSAVIGAYEICPKQVPPEVAKKVQDALSKKGAPPAPATK